MTRQELYKKVKELGISKEIEKKFGQNFTRVSNTNLEDFINSYKAKKFPSKKSAPKKKVDETTAKLFIKLVSLLQLKKYLSAAEADEVLKML